MKTALYALVVAWLVMVPAAATAAPTAPTDDYAAVIKRANTAYNDGDYDQAVDAFREAIQARPEKAVPYRNLARTYFWKSDYAAAVAYYDMYLRLATEADDRKQVQSERRLAASRAGEKVWTTPEAQRMALAALEDKLENGPAYTQGGGGAWGLYETLLRTGYAQPELARVRRTLVKKLLDEYEGLLVPAADQPTPRLDLQDWQVELDRLQAARELSDDEVVHAMIDRRESVAKAGLALLNGQFEDAASLAETAAEQNPDMAFVPWFRILALVELGENQQALDTLEAFAKKLARSNPGQLGYAKVLRANILQRMGRGGDAAGLYLGLVDKR